MDVAPQLQNGVLAQVARLELALEDVRRDVTSLSGCQDGCRRLDGIQQMVRQENLPSNYRHRVYLHNFGGSQMKFSFSPPSDFLPDP